VTDNSNEVTIYANEPARLSVVLFAEEASFHAIGDTIHYSIFVKNFRTTEMSDIVVRDNNDTLTSGNSIYKLPSGKTALIQTRHIITQKDLDAGKVVNVATARGKDYYEFIDRATSNEVTVFARQSPEVKLNKTAQEQTFASVGDQIHFTNELKNTGNVKITNIVLYDPQTTVLGANQLASLNPGESAIFSTVHTVTQTDLNLGTIEKTAYITGLDANGQPVLAHSNSISIKGQQSPQLTVRLSSAEPTYNLDGEIIHYNIEVQNSGNVTLTNVKVSDAAGFMTQDVTIAVLLPGNTSSVSVQHMVTLADLAAGKLQYFAEASGYSPAGQRIAGQSNTLVIPANLSEGVAVTQIAQETGYNSVGNVLRFLITVKNLSNRPLTGITVNAPNATITENAVIASLPAYSSTTVLAVRRVNQNDLDAGKVINDVTVKGSFPDGKAFTEQPNQLTIYGTQRPVILTSISADADTFNAIGQVIGFEATIKNEGNVTLSGLALTSQGKLKFAGNSIDRLIPGETVRFNASYSITIEDLDEGRLVEEIAANAKSPSDEAVYASSNQITIGARQRPELTTLVSSSDSTYKVVGDVIHYDILVKNSGNVSLISTAVTDPNAVIISARPNVILLPGESFLVTATHTISQQDINAGKVLSSAKAEGFDLNGNTIEKLGNVVTVIGIQYPELLVETTSKAKSFRKAGEVINYTTEVRNIGNVSIFRINVYDPQLASGTESLVEELLPGKSAILTRTRMISQADLDCGEVVNTLSASGFDLKGNKVVFSGNRMVIPGIMNQELLITAESSATTFKKEGDLIRISVDITNNGNVTMKNITVSDDALRLVFPVNLPELAPDQTATLIGEYRISTDEINNGKLIIMPIANGYDPSFRKFSFQSKELTLNMAIENFNLNNFPNPFSYETTITFDLPAKAEVLIKLFDMAGKEVGQIDNQEYNQGRNYVTWRTNKVQKGMYILKLFSNVGQATRVLSIVN
jgi:uncharacterized repeat protein (TIGR01451 family)